MLNYLLQFKLMIWKDVADFECYGSPTAIVVLQVSLPLFSSIYFIYSYQYDFVIFIDKDGTKILPFP